ncbi:MAG: response regulator transcription factor, partial [Planctomycetes bacterium]|nr:response regulator transcription factor [Planctomycetota bacterium]
MAERIRILVAEDHPAVRSSLTSLLGAQEDFDVVGAAEDGVAAVEMARRLTPQVVLMDHDMPRMK